MQDQWRGVRFGKMKVRDKVKALIAAFLFWVMEIEETYLSTTDHKVIWFLWLMFVLFLIIMCSNPNSPVYDPNSFTDPSWIVFTKMAHQRSEKGRGDSESKPDQRQVTPWRTIGLSTKLEGQSNEAAGNVTSERVFLTVTPSSSCYLCSDAQGLQLEASF